MQPNATPPAPPPYDPRLTQNPDAQNHDYSFILDPKKQPRQPFFSGASMAIRVGMVAAILLVLVIIFIVVRGVLSEPSNLDQFVTLGQQQEELIHLATKANQQKGLEATNRNFAITAERTLESSQQELLRYLGKNNKKVSQDQLSAKISAATDKELESAAANGTYNRAFGDTVKQKLDTYLVTLNQTYKNTSGPNGRELLSKEYKRTQLLSKMLEKR